MKIEQAEEIKVFNRMMYEIQKQRIALSNRIDAKKALGFPITPRVNTLYDHICKIETDAKAVILETLKEMPIYNEFFLHVKGIGESLASSLLAEIFDISKFKTPSSLWAYFGLIPDYVLAECESGHKMILSSDRKKVCPVFSEEDEGDEEENEVDREESKKKKKELCNAPLKVVERITGKSPKRKKGYHFFFNTRGRTIAWKIAQQFIKQGDVVYKQIYYREKARHARLYPDLSKLHVHNRAMRKMVKIFLVHLWVKWRELEGLDTRGPYVIDVLGHDSYINSPVG